MAEACPAWSSSDENAWRTWWRSTPKDELLTVFTKPTIGEYVSDAASVFLALSEGLRGVGSVSPNPLVGCVVRRPNGQYLASGGHLNYGGPHAEINATDGLPLQELKGCDVTVTLEPCAHHGNTPPCADALVKMEVKSVRYLVNDPNPHVAGGGAHRLREAGIAVVRENILFQELGEELAEIFLYGCRYNDLFVGLKAATTRDGVYAGRNTVRQWVTSERSRQYGHYLRLLYDAIAVGANTVLLDNPQLTVRSPYVAGRVPYRVVLDPSGLLCEHWEQFHTLNGSFGKSLWIVGDPVVVPKEFPGDILKLPRSETGEFQWSSIKNHLWSMGHRSLLLEGGAGLWDSALRQKAVQKIHWFVGHAEPDYNGLSLKWAAPSKPSGTNCNQYSLGVDEYFEWSLSGRNDQND